MHLPQQALGLPKSNYAAGDDDDHPSKERTVWAIHASGMQIHASLARCGAQDETRDRPKPRGDSGFREARSGTDVSHTASHPGVCHPFAASQARNRASLGPPANLQLGLRSSTSLIVCCALFRLVSDPEAGPFRVISRETPSGTMHCRKWALTIS